MTSAQTSFLLAAALLVGGCVQPMTDDVAPKPTPAEEAEAAAAVEAAAEAAATAAEQAAAAALADSSANQLSPEEVADGWQLLFDGESLAGWRGFRNEDVPDGWAAKHGTLVRNGSGGDIITIGQYGDFELSIDWRVAPGGNSGIFFHVTEQADAVFKTGPELQVLDNAGHRDGQNVLTSAGANYALIAPASDATLALGEWNHVLLRVQDGHVEHWLNDTQLLEYDLGSPEWEALVAATKFTEWPGYGRAGRGHIALQDHGDLVWYRNIKLREL